jgi:predicted MFS family arabinose efflux permease
VNTTESTERKILIILIAVQFINILDFMMVMPLGPDYALALGIAVSRLGIVGGAYTVSACVSGLACSLFLDRFDRRPALAVSMIGLAIGTSLGAFAQGLPSMVAARLVAGAFGGPATALTMAIVSDIIPPERRGKAVGMLMGAFAAASVLGVPFGLKVAEWGTWRTPFFAVAIAGGVNAFAAYSMLPSLRSHLDRPSQRGTPLGPEVWISLGMTFFVNFSAFLMIPNFATFLQNNMHYPRASLGGLYMLGGVVSFVTTRLAGIASDKIGSARIGMVGTACVSLVMYTMFVLTTPLLSPLLFFPAFMFSMGLRNVAVQSIATKVPRPEERARFGSFQSAVQHGACAAGAMLSAKILVENNQHQLTNMHYPAWLSILASVMIPILLFVLEARIAKRAY